MHRLSWFIVAAGLCLPAHSLAQMRPDPAAVHAIPVGDSPVRGPMHAPVTLVYACEFGSPYCDRVRTTFDQLMKNYEGKLRIVYKHFVIYAKTSNDASLAACAAHQQGQFAVMEDLIWQRGYRANRDLSLDNMRRLAGEAGLKMKRFEKDMKGVCQRVLAEDQELMRRVGTRGVPASYVNGRFLSGAQPLQKFSALIDEELAKAEKRIAKGTSRKDYYRTFVVAKGEKKAALKARPVGQGGGKARPRPPRRGPDPAKVYAVPVGESPTRGPDSAMVTLVLGCQFSGPFCKRLQPTLEQLRREYGKDLRMVFKHFIVHRSRATAPALAACAAHQQGRYDEMDAILWGDAYDKRSWDADSMRYFARRIGLNMSQYEEDIAGVCPDIVRDEQKELEQVGARGTPNSWINGRFLSGARPIDDFRTLIDEELKKADKRIKNRRDQKRYYQRYVIGQGEKSLQP